MKGSNGEKESKMMERKESWHRKGREERRNEIGISIRARIIVLEAKYHQEV